MSGVYLVNIDGTSDYKIGRSSQINSRISSIQTSNPNKIILIKQYLCIDPVKLEKELHELFGKNRGRGEWFIFDYVELQNCIDVGTKLCNEINGKGVGTDSMLKANNTVTKGKIKIIKNKNPNYECTKCKKNFGHKGDYEKHINRKTSCIDNQKNNDCKYKCHTCDKTYSTNGNMNKHLKKCKVGKKSNELDNLIDNELKELMMMKEKFNGLMAKIIKKETYIESNIKLTAFGNEDLNYITEDNWLQILSSGSDCVKKLIECIHFNINNPKYHNVYIPNFRNPFVLIFNGNNWDMIKIGNIIDQLKDEKTNHILQKFKEMKEQCKLNDDILNKMEKFINEKDEDSFRSNLNNEIKLMLYNKRNIVVETKRKVDKPNKDNEFTN
jgi:hypothetical protein